MSEREKCYVRDLKFLSKMAVELVNFPIEDNLCQFIAEQLKELVGTCMVAVNSFDESSQKFCVCAVLGIGRHMDKVLKILGRHPLSMTTPINEDAREGLTSGRLEKVPGGLYELAVGSIPKTACDAVEKILGLKDTYAMGFSWSGKLYGSAVVFMHRGSKMRDPSIIETFIRQASVAFQRRQAEQALLNINKKLETLVKRRTEELARSNVKLLREIAERKKAEEQLKASLEEKEVMLRELHHRVKNNMQIVSSLLRLQSCNVTNKELLSLFNETHNRIRTMALIHEGLYGSKDLARINFADYVERITTHLFSVYNQISKNINLKLEVGEIYFDINTAIPCGLIVNELVTNSLKHAFLEGESGEICIKIEKSQDKYSVLVKDTGSGFPEGMDFHMTKTLGMQLVTDLVKQLNGRIRLDRRSGTKFKISF